MIDPTGLPALGAEHRSGRLGPLWALLFPSRCLGCDRRGYVLCTECVERLPWLPSAVCPRCAVRSVNGRLCPGCTRGGSQNLAAIRAACTYEGVIRTAIRRLKFRSARYLAAFLARVLAENLARRPLTAELVLPVPLSSRRQLERGFNQSELIAAELARIGLMPPPRVGLLIRSRDTRPQVGLSRPDRRMNVRDAFACPTPHAVTGRRVLLIDDVSTTGATLEACAAPLRRAGAAQVLALVAARSHGPDD